MHSLKYLALKRTITHHYNTLTFSRSLKKQKDKQEKQEKDRMIRRTHQVVCLRFFSILASVFCWPWFDLRGLNEHGAKFTVLRCQGLHHVLWEYRDTVQTHFIHHVLWEHTPSIMSCDNTLHPSCPVRTQGHSSYNTLHPSCPVRTHSIHHVLWEHTPSIMSCENTVHYVVSITHPTCAAVSSFCRV